MKTGTAITLGVVVLITFIVGSTLLGTYNSLAVGNVNVDTSWANVQSQYQRRYDLIPNLVGATKGYLKQEQKVFGDIAEARTHYAGAPAGSAAQVSAASSLDSALSRLMVIVENYPDLKSNVTVAGLMDELAGTENRINIARDRYNVEVRTYNTGIKRFPTNIIASMFGFESRAFFEATTEAATAPTVNLVD